MSCSKNFRSLLVMLIFLSYGGLLSRPAEASESFDLKQYCNILKDKGLQGFTEVATSKESTIFCPVICSDKYLDGLKDDDSQKQKISDARKFGEKLLHEVIEFCGKNENKPAIDKIYFLIKLRNWCAGENGYGNLVLVYAIEDEITKIMFRMLNQPELNLGEIKNLNNLLLSKSPKADYWIDSMASEKIPDLFVENERKDMPDFKQMKFIITRLNDAHYAIPGASDMFLGLTYVQCYEKLNYPQVAWNYMLLTIKKISIECCIDMQESNGNIPKDKTSFLKTAEKSILSIMNRQDQIVTGVSSLNILQNWNNVNKNIK